MHVHISHIHIWQCYSTPSMSLKRTRRDSWLQTRKMIFSEMDTGVSVWYFKGTNLKTTKTLLLKAVLCFNNIRFPNHFRTNLLHYTASHFRSTQFRKKANLSLDRTFKFRTKERIILSKRLLGITHLSPHNEQVHLPYIAVATNTRAD